MAGSSRAEISFTQCGTACRFRWRRFLPSRRSRQSWCANGIRALELGTFLNTPSGEFVEKAVALAVPRGFVPEFALLVEALKLAAKLQQGEARGTVILSAIGAVFVGVVVNEVRKAA